MAQARPLLDLPTGSRGRVLALALLVLAVLVLLFGIAEPLVGWYGAREQTLNESAVLLRHMRALAAEIPSLEQATRSGSGTGQSDAALIKAPNDTVAAAMLQQRVQALASESGIVVASVEVMPGESIGPFRKIALRVALQGEYSALVAMLGRMEGEQPRILLADLSLRRRIELASPNAIHVDAGLIVSVLRKG